MRWEILLVYQQTFSLLVNGQVDPLSLDKSGPILSTPTLISEQMVLSFGALIDEDVPLCDF